MVLAAAGAALLLGSACGSGPTSSSSPTGSPAGTGAAAIKVFAYVAPLETSTAQIDTQAEQLRSAPGYGISWKFRWSTIEPQDGVYDWSLIDRAIQDSQHAGKKVMLRVVAGIYSPPWIAQEAAMVTFSNAQLFTPANYPPTVSMPIPWDQTYLSKWEQFIAAYGQRYNANPEIWSIQMPGGGFIGEMSLPQADATWAQVGYTDAKITAAWESIVTAFRQAFAGTPTNLDIDEPLSKGHALPAILSWVLQTYPGKVYIQQNGLRAAYADNLNLYRQDIRAAAQVTTVGYQMYGGSGSILSSKTGDRMTAFEVAVSDHARYLEVYSTDLLNPALSPAIQYLLSARS
jgi:hypothetical protein